MLEESASLFTANPKAKETEPCNIFNLPSVIIHEIVLYLDVNSLFSFEQTCKRHCSIIAKSQLYKKRCLYEFGRRFESEMNPIYTCSEDLLSWKAKYILLKFFPTYFCALQETTQIDESGLTVTKNKPFGYLNVRSNYSFITCNPVLLELPASLLSKVLMKGVEYFEVRILKNTHQYNECIAIGISAEPIQEHRIVGWEKNTIADDGTLQSNCKVIASNNSWQYSEDSVVGMGIDWERKIIFMSKNGKFISANVCTFLNRSFHPCISITCNDESVSINLGDSPFVFDIKDYINNPSKYHDFKVVKSNFNSIVKNLKYEQSGTVLDSPKRRGCSIC